MPRGPKGERRPRDVIGNAVHVMRIATGQITEDIATSEDEGKDLPLSRSVAKAGKPGPLASGSASVPKSPGKPPKSGGINENPGRQLTKNS